MAKDEIRSFIFKNFRISKSKNIEDSSALLDEGVLDSLGILEIVNFLQDELGISVEDEELVTENFQSIDAIASFVDSKTAGQETV